MSARHRLGTSTQQPPAHLSLHSSTGRAAGSTAQRDRATPYTLISLDRTASGSLIGKLSLAGSRPRTVHSWGSPRAREDLVSHSPTLVVMDIPSARPAPELGTRVRALSRLAHVVVLIPSGVDPLALLKSGATNVLERDAPSTELAARIRAEGRWLSSRLPLAAPAPVSLGSGPVPIFPAQRFLLEVLLAYPGPWCCHDLGALLGTADSLVGRRSLRSRAGRIAPFLHHRGLDLEVCVVWGRTTWQVVWNVHDVARASG